MSIGIIIFGLLGLCLYFLPTIIAEQNKKKNSGSILVVNLFLGWTFIGWIVALSWAMSKDDVKVISVEKPVDNSTTYELEKLVALKEKGALTQEEFDTQKRKVLGV